MGVILCSMHKRTAVGCTALAVLYFEVQNNYFYDVYFVLRSIFVVR